MPNPKIDPILLRSYSISESTHPSQHPNPRVYSDEESNSVRNGNRSADSQSAGSVALGHVVAEIVVVRCGLLWGVSLFLHIPQRW